MLSPCDRRPTWEWTIGQAFTGQPADFLVGDRLRRRVHQAHADLQARRQEPPGGVPVRRGRPGRGQRVDLAAQHLDQVGLELLGGLAVLWRRVVLAEGPQVLGLLGLLLALAGARGSSMPSSQRPMKA